MDKELVKDITAKMQANIVKYKNYIQGGKTSDEGICIKVLNSIKKAEEQLQANGVEIIPFNPNNLDNNLDNNVDNNNTNNLDTDTINDSKENTRKKLPVKKKLEKDVFCIYPTKDLENKIKEQKKQTKLTTNGLLNHLIEEMFDRETGKFKIDIEPNLKKKTKASSISIAKDIIKAIKKDAKKTGYSEADYFNKLIEESLKKYE